MVGHGAFNVLVGIGLIFISAEEAGTIVGGLLAVHTSTLGIAYISGGIWEIIYGGQLIWRGFKDEQVDAITGAAKRCPRPKPEKQ
jgi:hypothetical protein